MSDTEISESGSESLRSFEVGYWRRLEKISWTDHVRKEEILHTVKKKKMMKKKKKRNIPHTITRRKASWIGHRPCRDCCLKHFVKGKVEGNIKVTGRRRRSVSSY